MARYIDADELTEFLWDAKNTTEDKEKQAMYRTFIGIINASPTVDIQEVKHGQMGEDGKTVSARLVHNTP